MPIGVRCVLRQELRPNRRASATTFSAQTHKSCKEPRRCASLNSCGRATAWLSPWNLQRDCDAGIVGEVCCGDATTMKVSDQPHDEQAQTEVRLAVGAAAAADQRL